MESETESVCLASNHVLSPRLAVVVADGYPIGTGTVLNLYDLCATRRLGVGWCVRHHG